MSTLTIQLFGDFQLIYDGERITAIGQTRQQSLLAYLLIHRHSPLSRQHLAFLFWPDSNESQAQTNLRKVLHYFRRALPDADHFLHSQAQTVQWTPDMPFTLDVAEFENKIAQANAAKQSGQATEVMAFLAEAVEWYQGELLPGCYDDWVLRKREQFQQQCIEALEWLMGRLEEQREYSAAIRHGRHLLQLDRLHEDTYRRLIRLYALNGDRASALRVYHTCAAALQRELGIEPNDQTQAAYAQLLKLETRAANHLAQPKESMPRVTQSIVREQLVGRQVEWQNMLGSWRRAVSGYAHFLVVAGEAGIGKTRLAEEMLRWASQQGIITAHGRAYEVEGGLAYAPVLEWLRSETLQAAWKRLEDVWLTELVRLLPELLIEHPKLSRPIPLTDRWQRQRLFEALVRAIQTAKPSLLLVLDDLQWCDSETLEWLHYLLRYDSKACMLVVSTVRPEEVAENHSLTSLLLNLRSSGQITEIELGPLTMDETAALADQVAGHNFASETMRKLYQETAGNPLFVVEMVRATSSIMLANGSDVIVAHPHFAVRHMLPTLPSKIYAIFQRRLDQLSPAAREIASLAAVIGRSFTLQVLAQASDLAEAVLVRGLDELWQRRLVREHDANAYDFSHDRIREVAYATLSPAQHRLIHRRVAQALENIYVGNLDLVSNQIASHYEQASLPEQAIIYYQRAAQAALHVYANKQAIYILDKALALLNLLPDTPARAQQELALQIDLGTALTADAAYATDRVEQAFLRALILCKQAGKSGQLLVVLAGLTLFYLTQARLRQVHQFASQSLVLAQTAGDPALQLGPLFLIGEILQFQGDFSAAVSYGEQSKTIYESQQHDGQTFSYGYDPGLTIFPNHAFALWCLGYTEQALQLINRAQSIAQAVGSPVMLVYIQSMAVVLYYLRKEVDQMRAQATSTRLAAQQLGQEQWAAHALIFCGWAVTQQGELEGIAQIHQGLAEWQASNFKMARPFYLALLADAYIRNHQPVEGLTAIAEALVVADSSGELWWEAELYRLHGELLWQQGALEYEVEACFHTAIQITRRQKAKSLELRAIMSLCRLWMKQGKQAEAYSLLAEVYHWFTEGFDTPDFQAAKMLLEELYTKVDTPN